jgi:hypothetical protein
MREARSPAKRRMTRNSRAFRQGRWLTQAKTPSLLGRSSGRRDPAIVGPAVELLGSVWEIAEREE